MNLGQIWVAVRYGFGGLTRFSGRDARRQFWPFAIFLFLATTALTYVAMAPAMMGMLAGAVELAGRASRDRAAGIPAYVPGDAAALPPELIPDFGGAFLIIGAVNMIAILLLAAAVTRRLHDRNRTGYWGLIPLPFAIIAQIIAPRTMAAMMQVQMGRGSPDFAMLMLNGAAYWATMIFLIVLLARKGDEGANRFGPAPPL
jgi:uncharacterized membrane protein YhaH (DUF805 family)